MLQYQPLHSSVGVLDYGSNYRLVLNIDKTIATYYRSLIPNYKNVIRPGYHPHITICRVNVEIPPNLEVWGKHQGLSIPFYYSPDIHYDERFYWLHAYSTQLEHIREELGLPVTYRLIEPPRGFRKNFHITIGIV